jgi:hypothetical protein
MESGCINIVAAFCYSAQRPRPSHKAGGETLLGSDFWRDSIGVVASSEQRLSLRAKSAGRRTLRLEGKEISFIVLSLRRK